MLTIYKYPVVIKEEFCLNIPKHHRILSVQMQNGKPFMWVLHRTTDTHYLTTFHIVGTGQEIPDSNWNHIATFQQDVYVWHLFKE